MTILYINWDFEATILQQIEGLLKKICRRIIVYNFLFSLTYVSRFLIKSQICHFRIYSTITFLRKFRFEIPNNLCHPEIMHFLLADVA